MREHSAAWRVGQMDGLEVLQASYVRHRFARHSHPTFAVVLIDQGAARYWYRGAEHVVGAGMVSLLNPDEVHTGAPAAEHGYCQRTLYLQPGLLPGAHFRETLSGDSELFARVHRLHQAIARPTDELLLSQRLSDVTDWLMRHHTDTPVAPQAALEHRAVQRLRELIEDDPTARIGLEQLAQSVGMSCAHLSRAFRNAYSLPPHAYRLQVRIERAKALLRQGAEAAQIAFDLGFNSQSHFITQFKRWTGVTPGHYS
ncbi:MAG: AraC family transcriptional regulator [Meiothermus sp.]|nr:AraC family transcriptional regulator [Meiothermus sp.]